MTHLLGFLINAKMFKKSQSLSLVRYQLNRDIKNAEKEEKKKNQKLECRKMRN